MALYLLFAVSNRGCDHTTSNAILGFIKLSVDQANNFENNIRNQHTHEMRSRPAAFAYVDMVRIDEIDLAEITKVSKLQEGDKVTGQYDEEMGTLDTPEGRLEISSPLLLNNCGATAIVKGFRLAPTEQVGFELIPVLELLSVDELDVE